MVGLCRRRTSHVRHFGSRTCEVLYFAVHFIPPPTLQHCGVLLVETITGGSESSSSVEEEPRIVGPCGAFFVSEGTHYLCHHQAVGRCVVCLTRVCSDHRFYRIGRDSVSICRACVRFAGTLQTGRERILYLTRVLQAISDAFDPWVQDN